MLRLAYGVVWAWLVLVLAHAPLAAACDRALADAYEQKAREAGDDFQSQAVHLRNAIELCPKTPKAYAELTHALLQINKIDEALSTIVRGVRVDPKDSEIRRAYGDVLRAREEYESALEQYESALKHAKIPRDRFYALAHAGWAQHGLKDHADSTRSWVAALKIGIVFDPLTNRRLYNMVAWNHAVCRTVEVCDGAAAVEFYERNPFQDLTWYELGTGAAAYARSGDFETAVALQEQSLALIKRSEISNKHEWLDGARSRMALYKQGLPYNEH